ncbi:thioredoxin-dependent peroxide reductase [Basidiobolus meristosporus CBS 931.73]|uniref:thioredoxin-dependent peroxiredoxin n=1 Tax=Basidiobolus meristosporus CBS 931.73 TaxID=1314790 RepID=A0A1Y1YKF9_9FUNG|nr:thioredoxin-dependent peroxide reductase [Basidiobolus meristosporus CBS 931.73]|eukprot:ORX98479.1 thioredoxin-dependent peroxide reductase [Basidiobolus meristosporus CBS 931.73]
MQAIRSLLPRTQRVLASAIPRATPRLVAKPSVFAGARAFSSFPALQHVKVQQAAPSWRAQAVVEGQFKELKLEDYNGKFLVMVFYPLDFTFVCPTELLAFSDRIKEFQELGVEVVGVSTDSEFSHLAWCNLARNKGGLGDIKIPLISDITKKISADYDVLIEDKGVALRGLFIIDPKGNVRVMQVNDLPIGRSVDETLRLIEAIQFTDTHGEVCPANWKKGSPTIKADPKNSIEYFEKVN